MADQTQPDLLDALGGALTPQALLALAKQLGLGLDDVVRLVKAILPALVEQLQHNAASGDSQGIASAVHDDHDGTVLDDAVGFLGGGFRGSSGAGILGHVFGDRLDATAQTISDETHLPEAAVRTAMDALAPLAMGAIAKVALGAVTAAGVAAVLAIAVQGVRSGKVQRVIGDANRRLDDDHDGNALDDVGRSAVATAKQGGAAVADAAKKVVDDPRVREQAAKAKGLAGKAAAGAKKKLKGLFGRFRKQG